MPEMHDVITVVRDSIIECNVSSGEVSRSLMFDNSGSKDNDTYETQVMDIEKRHGLLMAIKNTIIPGLLENGETYIHVVPYAKLFAELEAIHDNRFNTNEKLSKPSPFHESIPSDIYQSFTEHINLNNENNIQALMESSNIFTKTNSNVEYDISHEHSKPIKSDERIKTEVSTLLENIEVYNGSSLMFAEYGEAGLKEILSKADVKISSNKNTSHFMEAIGSNFGKVNKGIMSGIDQDGIDFSSYNNIKGCYIKYLDPLRLIPIRMDRRVIGYYYVSTTMDLQTNPAQPNGIVDLSYQNYTRDRNMVETLSNIIIKSFNKKTLEKNIKLKNEIAEIVMAHKFSEGRLSFIYIPEDEIIRIAIDEDSDGRGHSVLEPSLFPARMYLMLTMYNMLYTLNNNTIRVHYVRSSGLNKDYASTVQRAMRKFQSRRITIDDIYSYSGVLNKVGGMGEMVLPSGKGDVKAIETDTIPAVEKPIDLEFLETQRRQAISGCGVPNLMVINAIDEVDFAKTMEMANSRFISRVTSLKIDSNDGITRLYRVLMKYETDMEDEIISSFKFKFNEAKQSELSINNDMIQNFNATAELIGSIYYNKTDLEDDKGNPSTTQMILRRKLAELYLPQLNFDTLDNIINDVNTEVNKQKLSNKITDAIISKEDLKQIENNQ